MAEKIENTSVESDTLPPTGKKGRETEIPRESQSDLRALLLILVLAVMVFFILLYKQNHPQEYSRSLTQVKETADTAYAKAEEVVPAAYRGVAGFLEYVSDYGKATRSSPDSSTIAISQHPTVPEYAPDDFSGSTSSTGASSVAETETVTDASISTLEASVPMTVELSGYRIEFDRPPTGNVTVSIGGAKMTVGPGVPSREKDDVSE